jgi:hypothetical protein
MNHYALIALELANERAEMARRERFDDEAMAYRPSVARRTLARAFALNSRVSGAVARRLDSCVGDDLTRAFAAAE